ncbi:MAG: hypothetical protein WDO13_03840 [Verrucomicrobiota bacterium]
MGRGDGGANDRVEAGTIATACENANAKTMHGYLWYSPFQKVQIESMECGFFLQKNGDARAGFGMLTRCSVTIPTPNRS